MKEIKIMHLCTDEKFIDRAINIFEHAYPNQNLLCVYNKGKDIIHIKRNVDFTVGLKESIFGLDFNKIGHVDILVVHSLRQFWFRTIEILDSNIPVVWLGWGQDYYDLIGSRDKWLLKDTLLFDRRSGKGLKQSIKEKIIYPKARRLRVIERIQFFSPVIPDEYEILKRAHNWRKFPKQVDWNYGATEKDLSSYVSEEFKFAKSNVLVGNSATCTNNHIEIFNVLKNMELQGRKLIVPLNYGDMEYGRKIHKIADDTFGCNADVLANFMPLDEYMKKISSCGFVIMNHVRQQAVGNIVSMLYMGAKVFLREENPTFDFFKRKGIIIFSVQELERNNNLLSLILSKDEIENNRTIIGAIWSNEVLLKKTEKLISTLINEEGKIEA